MALAQWIVNRPRRNSLSMRRLFAGEGKGVRNRFH
jgi:hypothetical protein